MNSTKISMNHWPNMFKSKSSTSTGNQPHETSDFSAMRPPFSEEGVSSPQHKPEPERERQRSLPKAKPRWNPQPEQIRILETMYDSGMVNPRREDIRRIRAQLEEFGEVGEASVFYWFQNRKSKIKRRQRQQATLRSKSGTKTGTLSSCSSSTSTTTTSSSVQSKHISALASSPVNSMHNNIENQPLSSSAVPVSTFAGHQYDLQVNEEMSTNLYSYFRPLSSSFAGHQYDWQVNDEICTNQYSYMQEIGAAANDEMGTNQYSYMQDIGAAANDEMGTNQYSYMQDIGAAANDEMGTNQYSYMQAIGAAATAGDGGVLNEGGVQKESIISANPLITVFINGVPTEIPKGPINFRAFFGDDSLLIHSSGKSVSVNEWGYTSESLEHGAAYLLI